MLPEPAGREEQMGVYLSTPKTDKLSADGENSRLRFGLSSMQGWRTTMEDAVSCFRFPRGFRLGWNGIASAIAVPFHAGTTGLGVIWGEMCLCLCEFAAA